MKKDSKKIQKKNKRIDDEMKNDCVDFLLMAIYTLWIMQMCFISIVLVNIFEHN